jgi:hypothetical protein
MKLQPAVKNPVKEGTFPVVMGNQNFFQLFNSPVQHRIGNKASAVTCLAYCIGICKKFNDQASLQKLPLCNQSLNHKLSIYQIWSPLLGFILDLDLFIS